jgi:hypothetical protein
MAYKGFLIEEEDLRCSKEGQDAATEAHVERKVNVS